MPYSGSVTDIERGAAQRSQDRPVGTTDDLLAARIAWLHFRKGMTNLAIGAALGISRFRVARLLDQAIQSGLVTITINSPFSIDERLSADLAAVYGIDQAFVFPVETADGPVFQEQWVIDSVGSLAARCLAELLSDGDKVGVSWGDAINSVANALSGIPNFPRADIVQMVGGANSVTSYRQQMASLLRLAAAAHSHFYGLRAPLVVSDPRTAAGLRREASIKRILDLVPHLDAALVGIGSWQPPLSQVPAFLTTEELSSARKLGAMADICAMVIDGDGNEIPGAFSLRTIRPPAQDIRSIPRVIGVANGKKKVNAIRAVLKGHWVNMLVTDSTTASALLID